MSWLLFIICLVVLLIISFKLSKDFIYPGVLFCIPWLVFAIILPFSGFDFDAYNYSYLFLACGSIIFVIGCLIGQKKIIPNERLKNSKYYLKINYNILKIIMIIETAFMLLVLYQYYVLLHSNYDINILQTYYTNKGDLGNQGIIDYGRNFFVALGLSSIILYNYIENKEKKRYKKYVIIQLIFLFILAFTRMSRNGILFILLPILMVYIIIMKQKNKKVIKQLVIAFLAFLAFFCIFSIFKFFYEYTDNNFLQNFKEEIIVYGSGGMVAFQKIFNSGTFSQLQGINTFRFFIAIYDSFANTNIASTLVQSFINIGGGYSTNVYTFYQYYANDFGIVYALFIQLLVGILHGISYRKMSKQKVYWIYVYSILTYPLIMQFFQDQYISLLSTWIQMMFFGFIFLKTNILFTSYKIESEDKENNKK